MSQEKNTIILIDPIYKEIETPAGLVSWLKKNSFEPISISDDIREKQFTLSKEYETKSNEKGASKNDILLIAYAKIHSKIVVTLEQKQTQEPKKKSSYKIPLICQKENVECINFIELLIQLEITV